MIGSVLEAVGATPLVRLGRLFPQHQVLAKLELLNPAGSVKDRPARFIVETGLRDGTIPSDAHLVESSSGNLGIALATVARQHGLPFTCVIDPTITSANRRVLETLGARLSLVTRRDATGGFLQARIERARELVATMPQAVWINQYANCRNWQAHFHGTAQEVLDALDGPIPHLVAAVSTTGTVLGLSRRLRNVFPRLRVTAVDAVGSVIFGGPAGPRKLPGLGAGRVPELLRAEEIDEVVTVDARRAMAGCHRLASVEGLLSGASSGAVAAALEDLTARWEPGTRVLTLLPDRGERYLDSVYSESTAMASAEHPTEPVPA